MTTAPGGGIGHGLSRVLAETIINAAAHSSDHIARGKARVTEETLEQWEQDFRPILTDIFGGILASDQCPPEWRRYLEQVTSPEHQSDFFLQLFAFFGLAIAMVTGLGDIMIQPLRNQLYSENTFVPLSPADLADMVLRNIITEETAAVMAAQSGVDATNFNYMVLDTGEPPGIEQMLSLWRRGLLDKGTLETMIAYSRIRTVWTPQVELLAYDTMSPGDAIEGALKGVLDSGTAQGLFEAGGGLGEQFETLLNIAGNPIGVEAALNLWNHGLITEDQVTQVILHSRVNPIFEPMAKLLRNHWLPPFQIAEALKAGAISSQEATTWLSQLGYPADQVAGFVAYGSAVKVAAHKDLTESQVVELYNSGLFNEDQATAHLVALGYDPGETNFILAVYDQKRELTMAQAAINQVRKVYLAGRIDAPTAQTQLTALGVDPTTQGYYITIWGIEAASELKELTMAQVGSIYKKGGLDDADAVARWQAMGYSADDAALLLFNYGGAPPAGSPAATAAAAAAPTTTGA